MNDPWWDLPGPDRFLAAVERDLADGRSVVIDLPDHAPAGLEPAVRHRVQQNLCLTWQAATAEATADPVRWLFCRFAPHAIGAGALTERALAESEAFESTVLWVQGIATESWPAWRASLGRFAHTCRSVDERWRPRLCLLRHPDPREAGAGATLPDEPTVVRHAWRGRVDRLDVQLYVARRAAKAAPANESQADAELRTLRHRLKVAVAAELAGSCRQTADLFADAAEADLFDPLPLLRQLAASRDWSATDLSWARGQLDEIEGATFPHSAALAATGDEGQIRRRVWRGQVAVLFPFIEDRRVDLVLNLRLPKEVGDPMSLEIGELAFQVQQNAARFPERVRGYVRELRELRNELAHLNPVNLARFSLTNPF